MPDWPLHMAEKDWVDIHDFCTAFLVALACYPEFAKFNGMQIREGVRRAIKTSNRFAIANQEIARSGQRGQRGQFQSL